MSTLSTAEEMLGGSHLNKHFSELCINKSFSKVGLLLTLIQTMTKPNEGRKRKMNCNKKKVKVR